MNTHRFDPQCYCARCNNFLKEERQQKVVYGRAFNQEPHQTFPSADCKSDNCSTCPKRGKSDCTGLPF